MKEEKGEKDGNRAWKVGRERDWREGWEGTREKDGNRDWREGQE